MVARNREASCPAHSGSRGRSWCRVCGRAVSGAEALRRIAGKPPASRGILPRKGGESGGSGRGRGGGSQLTVCGGNSANLGAVSEQGGSSLIAAGILQNVMACRA
ncbi:hypothetical protein NDU88_003607 [Pleurodeles waltl]|uniref:Uncharacterized protein n=1 Tax=Pleurodeles waltl TaxID=8319 RepID=A0AAV7UGS8_PLEWA|nr:hypothetical protein NDU88_003607 [Pleurodeles waltl]